MQLSKNFNLPEFTRSQTATRLGIDNQPGHQEVEEIKALVLNVLQPLRDMIAKPFFISSGYRSLKVNAMIGGSRNSQHTKGQAVDFTVQGMTPLEVCHFIVKSGVVFDQLIYEHDWVHISYNRNGNKKQVLCAHFNRGMPTTYTVGLPAQEG